MPAQHHRHRLRREIVHARVHFQRATGQPIGDGQGMREGELLHVVGVFVEFEAAGDPGALLVGLRFHQLPGIGAAEIAMNGNGTAHIPALHVEIVFLAVGVEGGAVIAVGEGRQQRHAVQAGTRAHVIDRADGHADDVLALDHHLIGVVDRHQYRHGGVGAGIAQLHDIAHGFDAVGRLRLHGGRQNRQDKRRHPTCELHHFPRFIFRILRQSAGIVPPPALDVPRN